MPKDLLSPYAGFKAIRTQAIPLLGVTLAEFEHGVTRARHYHFAPLAGGMTDGRDAVPADDNQVFMVVLPTFPMDSTGIAHILEHTVLCGSQKYPVRDPFFMMLRRSLSNFMNAFTGADWTGYPFSTKSEKDFENLLAVYLDAVFRPNLDALDFAQEGWRFDLQGDEGSESEEMVYKGVVFNEMKGAMTTPARVLYHRLCHHIYQANTTYHYNSGGEPTDIPDLTHEALVQFHATHYHPSNAIFLTYGAKPATYYQALLTEHTLSRYDCAIAKVPFVATEPLTAPITLTEPYAAHDTTANTHIVKGWLWGDALDIDHWLDANLINLLLLDHAASPMRHALETTELAKAPSPLCGLEDEMQPMLFVLGVEGSEAEHTDSVHALIDGVLADIAENGVSRELLHAAIHQLELSERDASTGGLPYGLDIMMSVVSVLVHAGDVFAHLDLDAAISRLKVRFADPSYASAWVKRWLIDNPHTVALTLTPDDGLEAATARAEKDALRAKLHALTEAEKTQIKTANAALAARQGATDDVSILPNLALSDIPKTMRVYAVPFTNKAATTHYHARSNGLVAMECFSVLPSLTFDEWRSLSLAAAFITELGSTQKTYTVRQQRLAEISAGLRAQPFLWYAHGQQNALVTNALALQTKGLAANMEGLCEILLEAMREVRFDERARMVDIITQMALSAEHSVTGQGHMLAMQAAAAHHHRLANAALYGSGLMHRQHIIGLASNLNNASESGMLDGVIEIIRRVYNAMADSQPRGAMLLVSDDNDALYKRTAMLSHDIGLQSVGAITTDDLPTMPKPQAKAVWAVETPVQYCARAYKAPLAHEPDAPTYQVLATYLRDTYLHTAIREQGGAYGGGANFDGESGTFRFFSYRDPRLQETYADFAKSLDIGTVDNDALHAAILATAAKLDGAMTPVQAAKADFHERLRGKTVSDRQRYLDGVLAVDAKALQKAADRLRASAASDACITNKARAEALVDEGFTYHALREH